MKTGQRKRMRADMLMGLNGEVRVMEVKCVHGSEWREAFLQAKLFRNMLRRLSKEQTGTSLYWNVSHGWGCGRLPDLEPLTQNKLGALPNPAFDVIKHIVVLFCPADEFKASAEVERQFIKLNAVPEVPDVKVMFWPEDFPNWQKCLPEGWKDHLDWLPTCWIEAQEPPQQAEIADIPRFLALDIEVSPKLLDAQSVQPELQRKRKAEMSISECDEASSSNVPVVRIVDLEGEVEPKHRERGITQRLAEPNRTQIEKNNNKLNREKILLKGCCKFVGRCHIP